MRPATVLSASLIASAAATGAAAARNVLYEGEIDGTPVVMFDDGFWRPTDAAGVTCAAVAGLGEVCALPSRWARVPVFDPASTRPVFIADAGFISEVNALTPSNPDRPLTAEDAMAFVLERTRTRGLRGTVLDRRDAAIDGRPGATFTIGTADGDIAAFTIADQGGRFVVAETWHFGTPPAQPELAKAHASFIAAIKLEPYP